MFYRLACRCRKSAETINCLKHATEWMDHDAIMEEASRRDWLEYNDDKSEEESELGEESEEEREEESGSGEE
jgi:hypothetical protein